MHDAASVATPVTHDATRHAFSKPTKPLQVVVTTPSHVALAHGSVVAATHAARPARGAPRVGMHDPLAFGESQDSH